MSKLRCKNCSETLSNVCSPNNFIGSLLTETDQENLESLPLDDNRVLDSLMDVWECPHCGAIAVDNPNNDRQTVLWYYPSNLQYNGLMKCRGEE